MTCPNCKSILPEGAMFCLHCGSTATVYDPPEGFVLDPESLRYFRFETAEDGIELITWFDANSGEYEQTEVPAAFAVRTEDKPLPIPEPPKPPEPPRTAPMACPHCGNTMPPGVNACFRCGKTPDMPVSDTQVIQQTIHMTTPSKGIIAAALIVVLLLGGAVGGHFMGLYSLPMLPGGAELTQSPGNSNGGANTENPGSPSASGNPTPEDEQRGTTPDSTTSITDGVDDSGNILGDRFALMEQYSSIPLAVSSFKTYFHNSDLILEMTMKPEYQNTCTLLLIGSSRELFEVNGLDRILEEWQNSTLPEWKEGGYYYHQYGASGHNLGSADNLSNHFQLYLTFDENYNYIAHTMFFINASTQAHAASVPETADGNHADQREPIIQSPENSDATSSVHATVYRGNNGQEYTFLVTGTTEGSVWGSGTYTDDSNIAAAAVHAGIIKVGETAKVTIIIKEGLSSYSGSAANGVTTSDYGSWGGSYIFK